MATQDIGGLTTEQASGIQDIYKQNIASGMTPTESQAAIKADPNFAQAKAAYQAPAVTAPVVPQAEQTEAQVNQGPPPTPEIMQPQPVQPSQDVVAPKQPEQATTPQKTPVSKQPVSDTEMQAIKQNADDNRQREILANLNEGYKNDPAINKAITSGDYNSYKTAYQYDVADESKKKMLDAYFQARQPKDAEGVFQILKTGQNVANPAVLQSPDYAKAQAKYNIYSKLAGMSSQQLLTEMKNGNIGTEMSKELSSDPEFQLAKQQLASWQTAKDINKNAQDSLAVLTNKAKTEEDLLQKMSDKATAGVDASQHQSLQTYMKENAPELADKVSSFNQKNQRLRELSDERDNMLRTVIKDHPGMSKGAAMVLASRNNESLNDEIKSMSYDLQTMQADINYATEIAKADYDYIQKQEASTKAFEQQKELAEFQQELTLTGNAKEFEQKLKQQAQLASDPYTAISTVMDQYAKLGIPFTQSVATKMKDAEAFIAAGGTIGGYVDKMIKDIQAKDEYKAMKEKALTTGKYTMGFDPITGTPYVLNAQTGQVEGGGAFGGGTGGTGTAGGFTGGPGATGGVNVSSGTTRNRPDRNNSPGNVKIGDVGYGVDDQNHTIFGSPEEGYAAMVKDITAKLTGGSSQKSRLTGKILSPTSTLGDLGSVYAEDPKWAQSVARLSGYSTSTPLSQIDVNKLAPAIAKQEGFTGNISINTQANAAQQQQAFSPSKTGAFDSYSESLKKGSVGYKDVVSIAATNGYPNVEAFLADYDKYKNAPVTVSGLTKDGYNPNNVSLYAIWNKDPSAEMLKQYSSDEKFKKEAIAFGKSKALEAVPTVNKLIEDLQQLKKYDKATRVGSDIPLIGGAVKFASGDAAKFDSIYNQIIDKSSLNELVDLKAQGATFGALSDKELGRIQSSSEAGQLTRFLSQEDWESKIDDLIESARAIKGDVTNQYSQPQQTQGRITTSTGQTYSREELLNKAK